MKKVFQTINDLFEQHKNQIFSAIGLILFVDLLFAVPFTLGYFDSGTCRNFMVFGSQWKSCSFGQFAWLGWQWLAFVDFFIFLPVIAWAMIMPRLVASANAQGEEE